MSDELMVVLGFLIPFGGTALGAACVFLLKDKINPKIEKLLLGFAGGVMVAASIFSLLLPAIDQSENYFGQGQYFKWFPAVVGFALGILFLLLLDVITPHLHYHEDQPEGPKSHLSRRSMMLLAVTLHNVPEGMAVGVTLAAAYFGDTMTMVSALALSIGIAVQNFPEGAIVSLPLRGDGLSRSKAFGFGALSGVVEPIFGVIAFFLTSFITGILPYLLSFAAGAMIYVVVEELIPEAQEKPHSNLPTIGFAAGFIIMMILDVALG